MTHEEKKIAWAMARLKWYETNMPEMTMAEKFKAVIEEWDAMNQLTDLLIGVKK